MGLGRATRLVLWPLGVGVGVVGVAVHGSGPFGATSELVAGWSVIATGLVYWARKPAGPVGAILTAAGFAWLLAAWNTPAIGRAREHRRGFGQLHVTVSRYAGTSARRARGGGRPGSRRH